MIRVLLAALALLSGGAAARADTALTLSRGPDDVETLELSLEDLAAMPQVTVRTETEFTDGLTTFRGPLVRDVIERLALGSAETLRVTAANDYYVDIPASDFRNFDAILAIESNGARLSRREKGPIWLIYPISDNAELSDPKYISRLVWQVVRIEAL